MFTYGWVWTRGFGVPWTDSYAWLTELLSKGCGAGLPEPVVLKNVNVGLVYVL